ncbi:MAG TPA: extracellular solute-binding protein [Anaerolineae bacterium]
MGQKFSLTGLLFVLLLSACDLINSGSSTETMVIDTPTAETPVATPVVQTTPAPVVPAPVITETETTLTIWMPPEITLGSEGSRAVLNDRLQAFAAAHPDLDVNVEYKSASGQGSILNYLRTGQSVAPDVLPDLIAIPADQLSIAATENLIYPLNGLIEPALMDDLYPAAQSLAHFDQQIIGYPFALTGLTHLAYNSSVVTTTLPLSWGELVANTNHHFIFPAAGREGAILALEFYLAAGGTLVDENGRVALQLEPLTTALERLSHARNTGFILQQSSNMATLEETWEAFTAGSAALAQTTFDQFLQERTTESAVGVASIPGLDGPLIPLVNGWVWAISTPDLAQRALAAELLTELVAGPNLGEWSYQSDFLPARREAFASWPLDVPYLAFIEQELERAQPNPAGVNNMILATIGDAVFDVVSLTRPPQIAAEEAIAAVQR